MTTKERIPAMAAISPSDFHRPLPLRPHFSERPWGGDALQRVLGKQLPPGGPYGEAWELSDHPDGRSRVDLPASALHGMPFGEVLRQFPREILDRPCAPDRYPLLVKYIDASGDLSVQVHPDDGWCRDHGHPDRGKSECWYIMDCPPGTRIIYGYKPGTTEQQARTALQAGKLEELLVFLPVQPGDFVPVPPGTVHAMMAGLLVCEIQQSSNTTFRLYDWNRQPARQLHVDESMDTTCWSLPAQAPLKRLGRQQPDAHLGDVLLLENEFFRVRMIDLPTGAGERTPALTAPTGTILNVVSGSGILRHDDFEQALETGRTLFLPAVLHGVDGITIAAGPAGMRVLVTESLEI